MYRTLTEITHFVKTTVHSFKQLLCLSPKYLFMVWLLYDLNLFKTITFYDKNASICVEKPEIIMYGVGTDRLKKVLK